MDGFLDGILRTLRDLDIDDQVWLGTVLFLNPELPDESR